MRTAIATFLAGLVVISPPALAADPPLNKEGFWSLERDGPEDANCTAMMAAEGDVTLALLGRAGRVILMVVTPSRVRSGAAGVLATDTYRLAFTPDAREDGKVLLIPGVLTPKTVAALKLAREVEISVGGKIILSADVHPTGIDNAVDGVIACSKGESGWWGPGVAKPATELLSGGVPNTEGSWAIIAAEGACVGQAVVGGGRLLHLLGADGRLGLAVASTTGRLPRGRSIQVQAGAYAFSFAPEYDEEGEYMNSLDMLDAAAVGILRQATSVRVSADRKLLTEAALDGGGYPEIIDAVLACSRGETGWWGKGATKP